MKSYNNQGSFGREARPPGPKKGRAAFVIPFWSDGDPCHFLYLREALESIRAQAYPDVFTFIVDDYSECRDDTVKVTRWTERDDHTTVLRAPDNRGPGRARNLGVHAAVEVGAEFVCFLDADDVAHKDRVAEVRRVLAQNPDVDLVYSTFQVVDENGSEVPRNRIASGIRSIMEDIGRDPLEGYDCWVELAVGRDNLTIPSALNVRTELAAAVPFPESYRFHEDTHTWLRYSAAGARIAYAPNIPSKYRIPQRFTESASRERAGGVNSFRQLRAEVVGQGLEEAVAMGIHRRVIDSEAGMGIRVRFLLMGARLLLEDDPDLAGKLIMQAQELSQVHYSAYLDSYSGEPNEREARRGS